MTPDNQQFINGLVHCAAACLRIGDNNTEWEYQLAQLTHHIKLFRQRRAENLPVLVDPENDDEL